MNKKQKLGLIGIIATGVMLASSVSFTVAWYTGSSHLSINNFNIEFANQALTISSDNEVFKDRLTQDDLMKVAEFIPVSSMHHDVWVASKAVQPVFYNLYDAYSVLDNKVEDAIVADHGFLSQPIYLKSTADATISIDASETYLKANHQANSRLVEKLRKKFGDQFTDEEILQNLDKIEKSLRLSFLVLNDTGDESLNDYAYYIVDPYKDTTTKYGGLLDMDGDTYYDYIQGKEALTGEFSYVEDKLVYDSPSQEDGELVGQPTAFNARTKKGVSHLDIEKSISNGGLNIVEEKSISLQDAKSEIKIPLKAGVSKKIYLSLYLEGWDLDNTNFAMYSYFNMNLSFMMLDSKILN